MAREWAKAHPRWSMRFDRAVVAANTRERVNWFRQLVGLPAAPVSLGAQHRATILSEWDLIMMLTLSAALPVAVLIVGYLALGQQLLLNDDNIASPPAAVKTTIALIVGSNLFNGAVAAWLLPRSAGLDLSGGTYTATRGLSAHEVQRVAFNAAPRWLCFVLGFAGVAPAVQTMHDIYAGRPSANQSTGRP